jgi:hypothetical protein
VGAITGYASAGQSPFEQLVTTVAGGGVGLLFFPIAAAAFKLVVIIGLFGVVAYLVYLLAA